MYPIFRHSYGEQFSKSKWMKEMVGQRELLSAFAGIPLEDIRGMRAPFLAVRTPFVGYRRFYQIWVITFLTHALTKIGLPKKDLIICLSGVLSLRCPKMFFAWAI